MQRVFIEEEPYLDDLAVGDVTFPEHLHHLETIFQRCMENNISMSPSKCTFNQQSLNQQSLKVF